MQQTSVFNEPRDLFDVYQQGTKPITVALKTSYQVLDIMPMPCQGFLVMIVDIRQSRDKQKTRAEGEGAGERKQGEKAGLKVLIMQLCGMPPNHVAIIHLDLPSDHINNNSPYFVINT